MRPLFSRHTDAELAAIRGMSPEDFQAQFERMKRKALLRRELRATAGHDPARAERPAGTQIRLPEGQERTVGIDRSLPVGDRE